MSQSPTSMPTSQTRLYIYIYPNGSNNNRQFTLLTPSPMVSSLNIYLIFVCIPMNKHQPTIIPTDIINHNHAMWTWIIIWVLRNAINTRCPTGLKFWLNQTTMFCNNFHFHATNPDLANSKTYLLLHYHYHLSRLVFTQNMSNSQAGSKLGQPSNRIPSNPIIFRFMPLISLYIHT